MLFCPKCQQLEATTPQKHEDGTVTYLCKKCGGVIPLRRDLKPGEIVAGFEIGEELGRGAMGIVYQARQTNLDREVAIKILSDDSASDEVYVERFFREARAAASLSHPNVVQAYDAGVTQDGIYYFVMEKVTGENLELVLKNVGPLNIPQALDVFLSVANALSYAWTRNQLSHGDIKPENIIMRLNGKIKLADFGLARRAKDPDLAEEDIRATPAYAPPEIIRGDKDVPGFKSDMYSFGATAYHILIGHEPFVGTDPVKVCAMQMSDTQIPLSELNPNIPQRLSDLVDALMEKDPENRPAAWSDVVDELKAIRSELSTESASADAGTEKTPGAAILRSGKKLPLILAAVVAAVVLLAVFAVIWMRSGTPEAPDNPPQQGQTPDSGRGASVPSVTLGDTHVRDEAFYMARWKVMQNDAGGSTPGLEQLEKFVSEAGEMAPAEAVDTLKRLRATVNQSRILTLRNELLDQAAAFKQEDAARLDFDRLDALYQSVQSKFDELKQLDDAQPERFFLPEQRETVEAYLRKLIDLQMAMSLGGTASPGDESEKGKEEETVVVDLAETKPPESTLAAEALTEDSKLLLNYLLLLDSLPDTIANEEERAGALGMLNDLLADKSFTDDVPRKNCIGIRKFLVLNQMPLLPYLTANKDALKDMKLFPLSYPDSIMEDIVDTTFRLKLIDGKANILQKVSWSALRKEEGEDRIVVTLINSPQLAKLSEDFREYLYVRAIFLGVDPDLLKKRYDRASGLPSAKRAELNRIAGFFQQSELDEEDDGD